MTEWFEQWFGEEYLHLYPHRGDEDAEHMATLLSHHAPFAGSRVLDLACGPGRHAAHFVRRGAHVVGFDLSMPLLSRARHRPGPPLTLVRGDMRRLPFRPGAFDLVVNLFTSFGYFADDAQHLEVLRQSAAVLKPGGTFVLDYFNADQVRRGLVPHERQRVGNQHVAIERRITRDGRFVVKEIHLVDDGRSFVERVRLFDLDDLKAMLRRAGLRVGATFGDYDAGPVAATAPRVILLATRP